MIMTLTVSSIRRSEVAFYLGIQTVRRSSLSLMFPILCGPKTRLRKRETRYSAIRSSAAPTHGLFPSLFPRRSSSQGVVPPEARQKPPSIFFPKLSWRESSERAYSTKSSCTSEGESSRLTTSELFRTYIHGSVLKIRFSINCTFGYFPLIRPPPFPPLKTLAYLERTPLLDPVVDIEGWIPAKKVEISGILFKSRPVAIDCEVCGPSNAFIASILTCNTFEALSICPCKFLDLVR